MSMLKFALLQVLCNWLCKVICINSLREGILQNHLFVINFETDNDHSKSYLRYIIVLSVYLLEKV